MSKRPRLSVIVEPTDRSLVRLHWPEDLRPAYDALMDLEETMAGIVISASEPALGAIKLAWWREALEQLDAMPAPPEPRLEAAALHLLGRGVSGAMLGALERGYAALLAETINPEEVRAGGRALAAVAGRILGCREARLGEAGEVVMLGRSARLGFAIPDASAKGLAGYRFSRQARPFTALARLAARDIRNAHRIEAEATPARATALLSHRLFGTVA